MKRLLLLTGWLALLAVTGAALAASRRATPTAARALWWTNTAAGAADLWLGDPDTPQAATRRWHSPDPILEAALSPDGARLALVTDSPGGQRLWLGLPAQGAFRLIDLAPGLGGLVWDGGNLVYGVGSPRSQTATAAWQTTLMVYRPADDQRQTWLAPAPGHTAQLLGRDSSGQPVLLRDGRLPGDVQPLSIRRSRNGQALLWSDRQQVYWGPLDEPAHTSALLPPWGQRCGFAWFQPPNQIVLCQVDAAQPRITLWLLDHNGARRLLGTYPLPPNEFPPAPLAFSPDGRWLALARYPTGFFWLDVPNGIWRAPAVTGTETHFIGWLGGRP